MQKNLVVDEIIYTSHIPERLEALIGARIYNDLYQLINSTHTGDLSFENASNHKIILDLKEEFHNDFKYCFTNYSENDILLLKYAFFYYREKIYKVKNMEYRKNPKEWDKPYLNAIEKLRDYFHKYEPDTEIKLLQTSLQRMEAYIHLDSFHKRELQQMNNNNIGYYLEQLENKSLSQKRLLNEFKRIDELLGTEHIDKILK